MGEGRKEGRKDGTCVEEMMKKKNKASRLRWGWNGDDVWSLRADVKDGGGSDGYACVQRDKETKENRKTR